MMRLRAVLLAGVLATVCGLAATAQQTPGFVPVTDATFWSDPLGEARTTVALVAVNHARCQILAPHQEIDPWAGLGAPGAAEGGEGSSAPPPAEKLGW